MAPLTLDWIQLAAVVGTLQGILLTGVLLAQRANRTANRLLAALMIAFTIYLASSVYYAADLITAYPHFFGWSHPLPWLFGPLLYLYAVAASDRSWRFQRRHLWHLAPPAAVVLAAANVYVMGGAEKIAFYRQLLTGDVPANIAWVEPTKFISGIGYTIATFLYLRRHRRRIEDNYSNTARVNLRWLGWLAAAAAAVWLIATTMQVTTFGERLREEHVSLGIAVVVYAIGYMGLRQPEVFRFQTAEFAVPRPAPPIAPESTSSAPTPRYERSGLTDDEALQLEQALLRLMDAERPWMDSDLTLADLAARLDSTPHRVSEVLNAQLGQTFYDFVNGYRVREVQRRIEAGEAKRLKMLALALDAGFASKSTFNEAFKRHTSQTPSDFRAAVGG